MPPFIYYLPTSTPLTKEGATGLPMGVSLFGHFLLNQALVNQSI